MFVIIESLESILQCLSPAFTQPSFQTHLQVVLGWLMCLGKRTEYGIQADTPVSRKKRHPFDRFYNFFSRSAWTVRELAHQVAVASTAKRVATASGNHWVVLGLAIQIPGTDKIYCLPIHARLHLPGKGQPSEAALAREMLRDVLTWFPDRKLVLLGDGAYSTEKLLADLDPRVTHVGVMRSDAALFDPRVPRQPKGKRGRKPQKGLRLLSPKEAMKKADRNRNGKGPWAWQSVEATAYGVTRSLQVLCFQAVWPKVLGLRPILVVLVRDPERRFKDTYLFTTDLTASASWVIAAYARRWSIEVAGPHAAYTACDDCRSYNYPNVSHKGRVARITSTPRNLPKPRCLSRLKLAKVQEPKRAKSPRRTRELLGACRVHLLGHLLGLGDQGVKCSGPCAGVVDRHATALAGVGGTVEEDLDLRRAAACVGRGDVGANPHQ